MNFCHTSTHRAALLVALLVCAGLSAVSARAQSNVPEPRREQLLNGLRVLLLQRPGDAKVSLRLRVHSGAAFDLAGKEGTMALVSDALFPDPSTRQYVAEELGGDLDVRVNYDSIEIALGGNATEFDRLVELLRNALTQMRLAPEDVQRLKDARLKSLDPAKQTSTQLADRAIRARLFGTHPYGRAIEGTPESLARIARGDLMFARDRFLNPNNATLVIVGGFDPSHTMIAVRQFFGPWRKSETVAPATFRQPDAPDARALVMPSPGAHDAEVRVAVRGVSRSDKDRAAASLLASVVRERWQTRLKNADATNVSVVQDSNAVSGIFLMRATVPNASAASAVESARAALKSFATQPVAAAELERARQSTELSDSHVKQSPDLPFVNVWLDSITYGYDAATDARANDSASVADLQRVAARLFSDGQFATIVAGDETALRASLANLAGGVEVAGVKANAPQTTTPTTPRRP